MRKSADVVVIGGGTVGCATAYYIAKKGIKNIVLVEKDCLTYGSTGRCGAGIRQMWGTEMNCLISRGSCELFKQIGEESGYGDIEFEQRGYLLISYREDRAEMLDKNLALQNRLGINSKRLTPQEAKELVPQLNIEGLVGAYYGPEDGFINPFKATYAFALGAKKLGVEINEGTEVTGFETQGRKITAVITNKGTIATNMVINAAGPHCKFIGQMLGMEHPIEPERHQILITEPMEHMMDPMVMSFDHSSYCQQVRHGGFLMGFGNPQEPKGINFSNSTDFMEEMAKKIIYQLPFLKDLRVVRQWAGHYDTSPDAQPILGKVPEYDGYLIACGCGKGFMLAPMIGKMMSEYIMGEKSIIDINILSVERFAKGELIHEPAVV
jgi:sarcosine oxidase subunit beta